MSSRPPTRTILVVDDDEGLLLLMADTLRQSGYEVFTALSGREALEWAAEHRADLMLLDLKLRDLDGQTLLGALRGQPRELPFIIVTGQGDEKVAVEVMKRGALDYIMKDTALLDLLPSVVDRALGHLAQRRALEDGAREREQLQGELAAVAEREREKIGGDLHDGLGQLLTAVGLMCTALKEDTARSDPAVSQSLEKMSGMLREAVAQTRYLARGLVPVGSEPDSLQSGLAELAARTHGLKGICCIFENSGSIRLHDQKASGHLYRIAQEAVNNALKHARASLITIRLGRIEDRLHLEVEDDGLGLPAHPTNGVGLSLMRHRAGMIGADFALLKGERRGVKVSCSIPFPVDALQANH